MASPLTSLRPLVPLLRPSRKLLFLSTAQSLPFAAAWTPFFHRGSSLQWSNTSLFWVSSSNSTIHRVDLVAHPVGEVFQERKVMYPAALGRVNPTGCAT